jgi:hypothetical protein
VRATPAGASLRERELAQALAVDACIKQREPDGVHRSDSLEACVKQHPDAFLASLPKVA